MPSAGAGGPILVVGTNGSGSTLLRLMLDSHERIAIPEETGFLRLANAHAWVPYWPLGDRWWSHLGLTEDAMWSAVADFYGGLFTAYAEGRGKARWGDKTPLHVWHLDLALRLYPDAQVIGIVRHPGAVVASLHRRFRRPRRRAIKHWRRSTHRLLHDAAAIGDRAVILRYEDLVTDPEPVMRALLDWLDEPWSDAVLRHHEVQQQTGAPREVEGFTRTDRPVDGSQLAAWQAELTGQALEKVIRRTGALAGFLGYDPRAAAPAAPLAGSALLSGTELRARQRGDTSVDWSRPPRPRAEDRPLRPPAPRTRRRKPDLDKVTIRRLVRHKLRSTLRREVPEDLRRRAGAARRARGGRR